MKVNTIFRVKSVIIVLSEVFQMTGITPPLK
nr:MAG TPA: hypothetical protein [Caudoviricetes sp.]